LITTKETNQKQFLFDNLYPYENHHQQD
jgi:hypothetical protein